MGAVYSKGRDVAVIRVDFDGELPGVPVTKSSKHGLEGTRRSDDDRVSHYRPNREDPGAIVCY